MGRSCVAMRGTKLKETLSYSNASGDATPSRFCTVCGGERGLQLLGDTCPWSGLGERYDRLLADCFGVQVEHSDGMICERCVSQLRSTLRFKALVLAAFERISNSDCTSLRTAIEIDSCSDAQKPGEYKENPHLQTPIRDVIVNCNRMPTDNKKILQTLNKKVCSKPKRARQNIRKSIFSSNTFITKRTIVICSVCGHKYGMVVNTESSNTFICSRCKLKKSREAMFCRKCNGSLESRETGGRSLGRSKVESRGSSRLNSLPKKPSQANTDSFIGSSRLHASYQCPLCSRRFGHPKHLADHIRLVHGEKDAIQGSKEFRTRCALCGKDFETRNQLEQHLKQHSGEQLYECDICKRVFKGRQALQVHYLTHDKFR